jgi:hypothetical protein
MSKHKIQTIIIKPILTKDQIKKKEGTYFSETHYTKYNKIVTKDTDVYGIESDGTKKLLFKFRKNVISEQICIDAYNALESHAKHKNSNRGAAAGKLSLGKLPKHVGTITKTDKFRVFYKTKNGSVSKDNVSNIAQSNIAGYYDRPDRNEYSKNTKKKSKRIPTTNNHNYNYNPVPMCRTTQFTKKNVDKWKKTIPLIKEADRLFKKLVPDRYKIQLERAKKTPKFQIDNTAYSTITLNYNWRTASHCDSGDLDEGFGNLIVLEKSKSTHNSKSKDTNTNASTNTNTNAKGYTGGYLGFPRWGICVDVRQGDFLAMDVHEYHSNTPIVGDGRLSVVCYLRKKMINCAGFRKSRAQI